MDETAEPLKFALLMLRLLIVISFFLAGFGLVIEHLVISKQNIAQSINDEDSATKGEPEKTDKEKFLHPALNVPVALLILTDYKQSYGQPYLSSGFTDKPFTPPDLM